MQMLREDLVCCWVSRSDTPLGMVHTFLLEYRRVAFRSLMGERGNGVF